VQLEVHRNGAESAASTLAQVSGASGRRADRARSSQGIALDNADTYPVPPPLYTAVTHVGVRGSALISCRGHSAHKHTSELTEELW
jgi:hypothetical protein